METSLNIDISDICNLACNFCRVDLGESSMEFDQIKEILDTHKDAGIIGIGGGEPLLHPKFGEIINHILGEGRIVNLSTNLWRAANKLEEFYDTPRDQMTLQVSLLSNDPEIYAQVGGRNALPKVLENLKAVKDHFRTIIHHVVYKDNFPGIESMIDYVSEELNLPIRVNLAYPLGPAKDLNILSPDEALQLTGILQKKSVERRKVISGLRFSDATSSAIIVPCTENAQYFNGVNAGPCPYNNRIHYDVNGNKKQCEFMRGV